MTNFYMRERHFLRQLTIVEQEGTKVEMSLSALITHVWHNHAWVYTNLHAKHIHIHTPTQNNT